MQNQDATLVLKYVDSEGYLIGTEIEYDIEGPVPSMCECGEVFQYMVDTKFGPGHNCYVVECETAEARHQAEYECSYPYDDDFEDSEHFEDPEY